MHTASRNDRLDVVKELLDYNASPKIAGTVCIHASLWLDFGVALYLWSPQLVKLVSNLG